MFIHIIIIMCDVFLWESLVVYIHDKQKSQGLYYTVLINKEHIYEQKLQCGDFTNLIVKASLFLLSNFLNKNNVFFDFCTCAFF